MPHDPQKLAPGGDVSPQLGHGRHRDAPQLPQKRCPAGFDAPHRSHLLVSDTSLRPRRTAVTGGDHKSTVRREQRGVVKEPADLLGDTFGG